ncbi:cadmium-translocating P-type ATPase [Planctomycetales bacterium]|nr:cadmium-translocating P-type ATPase [Planctomycetales bacterium]GHS97313.1 cadmium-translocating P-type ATPase [Planctomycetales bacterium]GHT03593.1 cadmium-translocating P-type ATPase [Planctomycetales bacterium]
MATHCAGCDHCDGGGKINAAWQTGIGVALFAVGLILHYAHSPAAFALLVASYLLIGGDVLLTALKNLRRGKIFDENFLMALASLGAFAIGDAPEGAAVMLFYQIGEKLQARAVGSSRRSITALMDWRPDFANVKNGGELRRVAPSAVAVGEIIVVRPGEKVPLDGTVIDGLSSLDVAALTGESVPRAVGVGDEAPAGSVNQSGVLTMRVTKLAGESTVAKILTLAQNAAQKKSPTENFITTFARYYTPAVVIGAALLALIPPLASPAPFAETFFEWTHRALVFLVISCPCALVISVPLSFFGGIGAASRRGILLKGSNFLEALNHVGVAVFDKTGTLTRGKFRVTGVEPMSPFSASELLAYAAHAEYFSTHPFAVATRAAFAGGGGKLDAARVGEYQELAGRGVSCQVDGKAVLAGNLKLVAAGTAQAAAASDSKIYLAIDGFYAGCLTFADEVKPDAAATVAQLQARGIKTVMLTGDGEAAATAVAREVGVDEFFAELLPDQKVAVLEKIAAAARGGKKSSCGIMFVGDGINDAPVLARADVGVAMGGVGSDAAIEAADIVLMTDEVGKILTAMRIARHTRQVARQNIAFALGVKAVLLALGAAGVASMWAAVFGDVGVALLAILNALRAGRLKKRGN